MNNYYPITAYVPEVVVFRNSTPIERARSDPDLLDGDDQTHITVAGRADFKSANYQSTY